MGEIDLSRHIKWSADNDWYYGSITTVGPEGVAAVVEGKISRPWVRKAAMALRKNIMQSAPSGVDVGAWTNLSDPQRFQRLCQHVANERITQQIVGKVQRHGVITAPWFGPWTIAVADRAYELIVKAQAGDEVALSQLDRIREHAAQGNVKAREALKKINAVAKMVAKGLPKPSVLASQRTMMVRPALPPPARLPMPRLPEYDPEAEEQEYDVEAGESDDNLDEVTPPDDEEEYGGVDIQNVNASEDEIEFGSAIGWVANKFKSTDGSEWAWTGQSSTDELLGEQRVLRSDKGKDLYVNQLQLSEFIKEGELTPVAGTEIGATPLQRKRQEAARKRGKASGRPAPSGRVAKPMGRGAVQPPASKRPVTPVRRGQTMAHGATPASGTNVAAKTTATTAAASTSPAGSLRTPLRVVRPIAPVAAAAATSMANQPVAAAAAAPAIQRVPGFLYPGDPGYPLFPGMPGYGTPVAGPGFAGFPQGMPGGGGSSGGGGGGGGGEEFPDEGATGDPDAWGGDNPEDMEEFLPHDDQGNVVFPEEDTTAEGAEFPEEKSQSTDVDAGSISPDAESDVFPDEGGCPPGRG